MDSNAKREEWINKEAAKKLYLTRKQKLKRDQKRKIKKESDLIERCIMGFYAIWSPKETCWYGYNWEKEYFPLTNLNG